MATVTGKLDTIVASAAEAGSVEIALCGYGSQIPRDPTHVIARPGSRAQEIPVDAAGSFSATLAGNDVIQPAGTYYTVTIRDSNGDIVQCDAYLFLGNNAYDLSTTEPFDPTQQPIPPIPPYIVNLLQIIPATDTMIFDGSKWLSFKTTLPGSVTNAAFENMVPGNLYTFIIVQDGTGNHTFTWAANVKNATPVDPRPNSTTVQTFVADEFGNLIAISAGTYQ